MPSPSIPAISTQPSRLRIAIATRLFALALGASLGASGEAVAAVKVYDSTPPGGSGGDILLHVVADCSPVSVTPGALGGRAHLADTGSGSVTLESLSIEQQIVFDVDTTAVFGPGAFFFATQRRTDRPADGHTGTGSTAPGGTVSWGVLSGWTTTGLSHCIASPAATCSNNGFLHGVTVSAGTQSPTYDLGTWTFDAQGDYQAGAFVQRTANGGESNIQWLLRGTHVGASVPALPVIGAGALAAALLASGLRAATRRARAPEAKPARTDDGF